MSAINILHSLAENAEGEGFYIIFYNKARFIAYAKDKQELERLANIKGEIDDDLLEQSGIYLLKNIREAFHNAEEKTRKIIKYLTASDDAMNSEAMKIFIIMLTAYLAYQDIYLTAITRDPTLIDFFKDNNQKNTRLELLQNLFLYIVGYKGLEAKLKISEKYAEINVALEELDKNKSILNRDAIDPQMVISLFNTIRKYLGEKT